MKAQQIEAGEVYKNSPPSRGAVRVLSVLDFILRVVAALATLASAIGMVSTHQTLRFATRFVRFRAVYKDLPTLTYFVIANFIVCGYLLLSLSLSFLHIVNSSAGKSRVILVVTDMVMMTLVASAASAATTIVYIAHYGNTSANWAAFCPQFNSFCQRISGAVIGSFISVVVLVFIIIFTSIAISRRS